MNITPVLAKVQCSFFNNMLHMDSCCFYNIYYSIMGNLLYKNWVNYCWHPGGKQFYSKHDSNDKQHPTIDSFGIFHISYFLLP
jgi:hypothetical protein